MQSRARVSVVIPTKNDQTGIIACLEAIRTQTVKPHEVIVIDSGSTDGTAEAAAKFAGVRVVPIDPEQFNHGGTRNYGASLATGDYVLFTVQDARAADEFWIERLLAGFADDRVVAVCGHQAVERRRDTNPLEWHRRYSVPEIRTFWYKSIEAFDGASPEERRAACGWDNVTAIYRRDVLMKLPFRRTVFGEDMLFAMDAYRAGYALAFNPAAVVWHYHFEPSQLTFERTLRAATMRARELRLDSTPPSFARSVASAAIRLFRERELSWSDRLFWMFHNLKSLLAVRQACRLTNAALMDGTKALDRLVATMPNRAPQTLKLCRRSEMGSNA